MARKPAHVLNKEQLYQDYIIDNLKLKDIAQKYNLPKNIVLDNIKRYKFKKSKEARLEIIYKQSRDRLRLNISKEILRELYVNQNKSCNEIAKIYNVKEYHVFNLVNTYNLTKPKRIDISENTLKKLYIEDCMDIASVAKSLNVSKNTVRRRLKEYGIYERNKNKSINTVKHSKNFDITKDELYDLYVNKNFSKSKICELYNISEHSLTKSLNKYNIIKGQPKSIIKGITKDELYNMYVVQSKSEVEIAEFYNVTRRILSNTLEFFGISKIDKSRKTEAKLTNINKTIIQQLYQVQNMTIEEIAKKLKISKYLVKKLLKQYNLAKPFEKVDYDKYQSEYNIWYTDYIVKNLTLTELSEKYNLPRNKVIRILGYLNIKKSPEAVQVNARKTLLAKTGYAHPNQNPATLEKVNKTKDKNKTHSYSGPENQIRWVLTLKFPNIRTQYRNKKYPFKCDFYIPELDLYVEYQGYWSHGTLSPNNYLGPYDPNNHEHQEILKKWHMKASAGKSKYKSAINNWTVRDPLKRETAKRNNLNWIEFFNMEQFFNWYKTQKGLPLLEYKSSIQ